MPATVSRKMTRLRSASFFPFAGQGCMNEIERSAKTASNEGEGRGGVDGMFAYPAVSPKETRVSDGDGTIPP